MYYRRKLLLSILEKTHTNTIDKIKLQKILFLISHRQSTPNFSFVPYKYDCFSFQADKDLETLCLRYQLVEDSEEKWSLIETQGNYFASLKSEDKDIINSIFEELNQKNVERLFAELANSLDPYCTVNSKADSMAERKIRQQLETETLFDNQRQLFSIGYEGLSIDAYLNRLVKNRIALLCDIRKNPYSLKFDFSKRQLAAYCYKLRIKYIHMPEFGIHSKRRKNLKTKKDYEYLFQEYERNLPILRNSLETLKHLLGEHNRIALTCFEKDYQYCHRNVLASYYIENIEEIDLKHL